MEVTTARISSSESGCSDRIAGEWDAKRDASCKWFLLTKGCCEKPTGFLASEPAFRLCQWVGAETSAGLVATVFPEFIARDGQERADAGYKRTARRGSSLDPVVTEQVILFDQQRARRRAESSDTVCPGRTLPWPREERH